MDRLLDKLLVVCPNSDHCQDVLTQKELEMHLIYRWGIWFTIYRYRRWGRYKHVMIYSYIWYILKCISYIFILHARYLIYKWSIRSTIYASDTQLRYLICRWCIWYKRWGIYFDSNVFFICLMASIFQGRSITHIYKTLFHISSVWFRHRSLGAGWKSWHIRITLNAYFNNFYEVIIEHHRTSSIISWASRATLSMTELHRASLSMTEHHRASLSMTLHHRASLSTTGSHQSSPCIIRNHWASVSIWLNITKHLRASSRILIPASLST